MSAHEDLIHSIRIKLIVLRQRKKSTFAYMTHRDERKRRLAEDRIMGAIADAAGCFDIEKKPVDPATMRALVSKNSPYR